MADTTRNHGDHLPRNLKLWGAANAFTGDGPLPSPDRWVPLIPQEVQNGTPTSKRGPSSSVRRSRTASLRVGVQDPAQEQDRARARVPDQEDERPVDHDGNGLFGGT